MSGMTMVPQFTPDMYAQAGLNPNRQLTVGYIPITQEDRDHLGVVRNRKLKTMNTLAIVTSAVSSVAIIIGVVSIYVSAPNYNFPFSMGAGCISGFFGLCTCLICFKIVKEGEKTPTGDETTSCMRGMLMLLIFAGSFGVIISIIVMGIGGLWGLKDCFMDPSNLGKYETDNCVPNRLGNTILTIMTIIVCTLTPIMILSLSCLYCSNARAFGQKSGYEILMDIQSARMMEMQRVQAAQQAQIQSTQYGQPPAGNYGQPPAGNYGQPQAGNYGRPQAGNYGQPQLGNYGQPQAGHYPGSYAQPTQGQMSYQNDRGPAAPSAPTDRYQNHQTANPPPSYRDVMKR